VTNLTVPVSVLIAARNDARNLRRCLTSISSWADEVIVIDSQSTDDSLTVAQEHGARVCQFEYRGGWPKKRQWALDTYPFQNKWILLLDADEVLPLALKNEIASAIHRSDIDGYYIRYEIAFLGHRLRFGDTALWKLSLFRIGLGNFEKRLEAQDGLMCDMEVHEHVVVSGRTERLKHAVEHVNVNSLHRYIEKHNQYSNWESRVHMEGTCHELKPSVFGNQAQRRRFFKQAAMHSSLCPFALFLYKYVFRLGCLDGKAGFYYAAFQAIQVFHVQAKIQEASLNRAVAL